MRLALILLAGCVNPLIPPSRITTPENDKRRAEAAELRARAAELGDAHPIARRFYLGIAALRAGGPVPPVDLSALRPEIAVTFTGVACPLLEHNLKIVEPGNPALHVDLELSVEACAVDDHTNRRTETTAWTETVVDRIEEKPQTRQVCESHYDSGGDKVVGYGHDNGDAVKYVQHTVAGMRSECHDETWVERRPITHQEQRTGSHVIANHVVKIEVDALWSARRNGASENEMMHAHGSNESERTFDRSADEVMADDTDREVVAIRRGIAKLLAKEIAAEEALARAAANPDDADEHWARALVLGSSDNPLAKKYAVTNDWWLRMKYGTDLVDPAEQPERNLYETKVASDLAGGASMRLDTQYEEVAGSRGGLAGLTYTHAVLTRRTTERGGQLVDAAVGSAALGYADNGLAWDLAIGYGMGAGWRDGHGSGFTIGMRALARVTRLGDAQVYYSAVPAYARLELGLPHGSVAFDASGLSVSGRDVWRGAVLLQTQADHRWEHGHFLSLAAERARVHGRDGDTDLGAPELTTLWVSVGGPW